MAIMRTPTAEARALLDEYIQSLVKLGEGLSLDDFRAQAIEEARFRTVRIRRGIVGMSATFMLLTFAVLVAQMHPLSRTPEGVVLSVAAWCLAVGGIGAVANLFLHIMKLAPQPSVVISDVFEFYGRIVLGCLFSTILSLTLIKDIEQFFYALHGGFASADAKTGPLALAPFLFGYSIPLVLRILEKIVQAIEITIGAEDRRVPVTKARSTRRTVRRSQ